MTNRRTPLAFLLLAVALGLTAPPAGAQPSAPEASAGIEPEAGPEAEAGPPARPQSPEDEAVLRRDRLDALFARLAGDDNPDWLSVQNEIWAQWSQSGSPAMDLPLARGGSARGGGRVGQSLTVQADEVPVQMQRAWRLR